MGRKRAIAGFTLIEALVALVVVAVALSAIGMLVASTARGTRSIERQLLQVSTTQTVLAALPSRNELVRGSLSGELAEHRWRIDISPFTAANVDPQRQSKWLPQLVVVQVRSPDGAVARVSTIRLRPATGR